MSLFPTSTTGRRLCLRVCGKSLSAPHKRSFSTNPSSNVVDSDVVIVGGGPVGLALASALRSSPTLRKRLSVILIDAGDLDSIKSWNLPPGIFSNRVSSLTNASQSFLREIGAWNYVDDSRTFEMENIRAWDGVSGARLDFSAGDLQSPSPSMARLTENLNLQRGLLRYLDQTGGLQIMQRTKVTSISNDEAENGSWPLVHLDDQIIVRARLLVGADGFNSPVRSFARIPSFGWSYDSNAIVATMNHQPRGVYEGPNTTGYQRFLPTGPIAFLPLSPTTSSLVWSAKPPLTAALLSCEPDVLAMMINAAFRLPVVSLKYIHERILEAQARGQPVSAGYIQEELRWREQSHGIDPNSSYSSLATNRLGIPPPDSEDVPPLVTDIQPKSMASFPLRFNHAESYIGEGPGARTVLVGDAAHTIHPLAGQGLNLGLSDVECLARCIETSLLAGGDIGSYTTLRLYAQERYLANHALMSSVDKLHKLFSTEAEPIVWARSVGFEVLNELDTVKAGIMMTAGAQSKRSNSKASFGWDLAAGAVQTLSSASRATQAVKDGISSSVSSALKSLTTTKS